MSRTFQTDTLATLREIYSENSKLATKTMATARKHLAEAGTAAARARDVATILAEYDPEWNTPEEDRTEQTRTLRIQAWREALDFIEQHPELGMPAYESITICPVDGGKTTVEWVESLAPLGLDVEHNSWSVSAELEFGERPARAQIRAYVHLPKEPEPTPAPAVEQPDEAPAAEPDAQPDEEKFRVGQDVIVVKPGALLEFTIKPGCVAEVVVNEQDVLKVQFGVEVLMDGLPCLFYFAADQLRDAATPLVVGDRVRVHAEEYDGREGTVAEVDPDTFPAAADAKADPNEMPITVRLDDEDEPFCFAVAEVELLAPADDDQMVGVPA